ncbi:hypothetical protein RRG08_037049 [Elysia crispata]|uniref:Uncharacterized protein n=1 Tax=Elysia crispata TaxID=231223 RepID=A0AAE1CVU0_9GAST|nr:hypothetical protein RRG08_037049 [Elysia crispata]
MCEKNTSYSVTKYLLYQIEVKAVPNDTGRAFQTCMMFFQAKNENEQLCLVQDYPRIRLADQNVELVAYAGANKMFSLVYAGHLDAGEQCTRSNNIKLELRKVSNTAPVNISDLTIHLKVLHIGSAERRVDLAYDDCERTYDLNRSEISVYNRRKPQDLKMVPAIELKVRCQVTFKRLSIEGHAICFVYEPLGTPDCGSEWTLYILKQRNSLARANILYRLNCAQDKRVLKKHTWCAPNDTDQVTLLHWRDSPLIVWSNESKLERPETYRVVVTDFTPGPVPTITTDPTPGQQLGKPKTSLVSVTDYHTDDKTNLPDSSHVTRLTIWWIMFSVGTSLVLTAPQISGSTW